MTVSGGEPGARSVTTDDLIALAEAFDLGAIREARYLADGLMNRNWRVETGAGVFALKQLVDVPEPKARRSLCLLEALARRGLPVCPPRLSTTGEPVVVAGGSTYCLLPWAAGEHRAGTTLASGEAQHLGELLGTIHRGLASPEVGLAAPAESPRAKVRVPSDAVAEADRFLAVIAELAAPSAFDRATAAALRRRKDLLKEVASLRPESEAPAGPVGWTHGDFQPLNVLWDGSIVSAVLDWDRLGVRPYAEEVVRTVQVQFGTDDSRLDLERLAAFVAGYRAVVPIADAALLDAEQRLWWKRMTDFWQLQWHYDKNDHGPDALWESGERLLEWWTADREAVRAALTAG